MRSRLALLIAVAIVFAPGWDEQGAPQHPRASDLAARVVALTVDEGLIREAAAKVKHPFNGRQTKRSSLDLAFAAAVAFGLGSTSLVIFWVVTSYLGRLLVLFRLRFNFSRAPPRPQPA